jgi:hypothetical protein
VASPSAPPPIPPPSVPLDSDDRKWLHDKYERLASEEISLSASRTSYYAAIGSILVTGIVIALDDFSGNRVLLATVVTFLGVLGILISSVWAVLLHRTNDAQNLWREAATSLEEMDPPIAGAVMTPVTLRSGETFSGNLLRPYQLHAARFARSASWMDRANPSTLTEILPIAFLVLWSAILVVVWAWYLV